MRRLVACLVLACVVGLALVGCSQGAGVATLSKFNQVKNGMKLDAVVKIMGGGGKKIGDATVSGVHGTTYGWYGADPTTFITVFFIKGAVNMKAQQGLK